MADGSPTKTGVAIVDVVTGLYATGGIVAAAGRARGQRPGSSSSRVNLLSSCAGRTGQSGIGVRECRGGAGGGWGTSIRASPPTRRSRQPLIPSPIAATNERQFSDLSKALDEPELAARPRAGRPTRLGSSTREDLAVELESILRRKPCDQWVERLAAHGIPCSPVKRDRPAAFALGRRLGPRSGGASSRTTPARPPPPSPTPSASPETPASHRLAPPRIGCRHRRGAREAQA